LTDPSPHNAGIMGRFVAGGWTKCGGWLATALMGVTVAALFVSLAR